MIERRGRRLQLPACLGSPAAASQQLTEGEPGSARLEAVVPAGVRVERRSEGVLVVLWLDSTGAPTGVTRTGVFEYLVVDGRRITTNVGRDEFSFATGPISATPKAGAQLTQEACDALA